MKSLGKEAVMDVGEITDRLMIDLFKQKIQERELDPEKLKGTWTEARDILRDHFGRISRVMTTNQDSLQTLYQIAIKELEHV
jgi:uncharacterized membrane-anchored protein YhcB (DUF1043 family)